MPRRTCHITHRERNSLDSAAALAGIEKSAVHEIFDCEIHIRAPTNIGWIFTAKFQPQGCKGARRRAFDCPPPATDTVKFTWSTELSASSRAVVP